MARNLITDVAGVRVGHADDAKLGSGATVVRVRPARGRGRRRSRRRARHARKRAARSGHDGRADRRHRARRRLGVRPRCRLRRAGVAARAGPRLRGPRQCACRSCRRAILFDLLNGGDKNWGRYPPYRELGYAATAAQPARTSRSAASAPGSAPPPSISRAALGSASAHDARRHHRRRAGGGQCRGLGGDRRRAAFLGRAVRARQRIRRARPARARCRRRRWPSAPKASPARTPRWLSSRPTRR